MNIEYLASPPDNTISEASAPCYFEVANLRFALTGEWPRSALSPALRARCKHGIHLVGGQGRQV